jgi:hypothetical protein
LAQHGHIVDVVVDEQPRLGEAAVRDEFERLTGSLCAILDLIEPVNKDAAESYKATLNLLPEIAFRRPRRAEPPDTRVTVLHLMGVFAG